MNYRYEMTITADSFEEANEALAALGNLAWEHRDEIKVPIGWRWDPDGNVSFT